MFRKFMAVFISAAITIGFSALPASAKALEWDGISELVPGNTYTITEEITVKKDFTIPKGVKLGVREGGTLVLRGTELSVKVLGSLSIGKGGVLELRRGSLAIAPDSNFDVYGQFFQYTNTDLNVSGKISAFNTSETKLSGNMIIYKTGELFLRGRFVETGAGTIGVSGRINLDTRSEMRIEGALTVTSNGEVTNGGYLSVGKSGSIINSGKITLKNGSDYNRFGTLSNTRNGIFVDNREVLEYEIMTTAILVDEPAVEIKGIDVSYAQEDIDWEKVAETDTKFAIIRAGRGNYSPTSPMKEDDFFRRNMEGAIANGIDVGVYFYSYAKNVEEAIAEAEFFVSIIDGYRITYPVILDMEEELETLTVAEATAMVEAFFEVLMDNGYFPMIYSFKSWFEKYLDMRVLDTYAIWLAQLDKVTYQGGYYIWQYSHTGRVNGINGDVLLDISYIDFPAVFEKYGLNNL